ncbi:sunset domain-containing protein [Pseudonocardia abyssalis]
MLFHPPTSPYFGRTKAEVWFRTSDDAVAAGFTAYSPRRRGPS